MNPGKRDRRITLLVRELGRDELMAKREQWRELGKAWAMLVSNGGRTKEIVNSDRTQRDKVFRIRWREGITPHDNRVTYKGSTYKITATQEVGRKDMMDLICESLEGIQ